MSERDPGNVRFLVEMDGRSVDLARLPDCLVRDTVIPMAERLATLLAKLTDPLEVVFSIAADDGTLSVLLNGSVMAVNEARDAIGGSIRLSPGLN